MENRRTILALALSLLVLVSWSYITSKFYPVENKSITTNNLEKKGPPAQEETLPFTPLIETKSFMPIQFKTEKSEFVFAEQTAALLHITFPSYQNYQFDLQEGFLVNEKKLVFQKASITENSISFIGYDTDKKIIKQFIFDNSNYSNVLELKIQNVSDSALTYNLDLLVALLDFSQDANKARFQDITVSLPDKTIHINGRKNLMFEGVKFLGWRDRYFCGIIEPDASDYRLIIDKINSGKTAFYLKSKEFNLVPGEEKVEKFRIYLGPQDLSLLKKINPQWQGVIYYGTFDAISRLLIGVLHFLYNLLHNWGLAIIVLSILIYIVLYPLSLKQMRSMKQMQLLQPRIEELKKMYKDNPQKLNRETLELYKQNKVNPFGGCLPLVLQIPVFFALYQALMRSVTLKGAKFLWIKDLSEPDRLFIFPTKIPFLPSEINILPILMAIGMLLQQKMTMKATSGASMEQQKIMLILFPVMFGIIFYKMPSGLVLYWFTNSLLMLVFQFKVNLKYDR